MLFQVVWEAEGSVGPADRAWRDEQALKQGWTSGVRGRGGDDTVASLSSGYFTAFSDVCVGLMLEGRGFHLTSPDSGVCDGNNYHHYNCHHVEQPHSFWTSSVSIKLSLSRGSLKWEEVSKLCNRTLLTLLQKYNVMSRCFWMLLF